MPGTVATLGIFVTIPVQGYWSYLHHSLGVGGHRVCPQTKGTASYSRACRNDAHSHTMAFPSILGGQEQATNSNSSLLDRTKDREYLRPAVYSENDYYQD